MMPILLSELGFLLLLPILILLIEIWLWRIRIFPYLSKYGKRRDAEAFQSQEDDHFPWHSERLLKRGGLFMALSLGWIIFLKGFGVAFSWADLYFLAFVVALMAFDAKYCLLPDPAVYLLLWGGILWSFVKGSPQSLESSILGVVVIYVVMLLLYGFGWLCYKQEAIGRGDLKFSAAIGAWIGAGNVLSFLLMSSVIGILLATVFYLSVSRNWKSAIPFGPSLGFSGIILYFIERLITAL